MVTRNSKKSAKPDSADFQSIPTKKSQTPFLEFGIFILRQAQDDTI